MNLYEKLGLIVSAAVLTVLMAVGVAADRAHPETVSSAGTPDEPRAEDSEGTEHSLTAIVSTVLPPFAEETGEEVMEYLPTLPGFMLPAYADDDETVFTSEPDDAVGSLTTDQTDQTVPTTADAPATTQEPEVTTVPETAETEDLPEITPPPAAPEVTEPPVPQTTGPVTEETPRTTDPKPAPNPQTGNLRETMIEIAKSQIGVKEEAPNDVKYNTWFYGRRVCESGPGETSYAWCVAFLAWCADQSGIGRDIFPKTASVSGLREFFTNQGRYYNKQSYTPQAGDIVFFRVSHAGLVVSVDGDQIRVVEGNYSNGVALTTYSLSSSKLTGYASPDY